MRSLFLLFLFTGKIVGGLIRSFKIVMGTFALVHNLPLFIVVAINWGVKVCEFPFMAIKYQETIQFGEF